MYVDANLIVSGSISGNTITGQTITGTDTSVLSTNAIDLGTARDLGSGEDLMMRTSVVTAFSGGTSAEFQAIIADNAALSSNVTVIGSTGAIAIASLTAGARFAVDLSPRIGSLGKRYVGLRAVLVGAVTAGAILADYGIDLEDGGKFYPVGFTIS